MDNYFGDRLKVERERLGFSQDQMAEAGRVKKRAYCYYEANERAPDVLFLEALAFAGADVLYIVSGSRSLASQQSHQVNQDVAPYGLSADEAALLDNYRHSPPEAQAALRATSAALAQSAEEKPTRKGSK